MEEKVNKTRYLYNSHLGPIFFTDHEIPREQMYCRQCGDYDYLLGAFKTFKECWDILSKECSIQGRAGYCLQYIYPALVKEFEWDEDVPYADDYEKLSGFCCLSEDVILERILKHTQE